MGRNARCSLQGTKCNVIDFPLAIGVNRFTFGERVGLSNLRRCWLRSKMPKRHKDIVHNTSILLKEPS